MARMVRLAAELLTPDSRARARAGDQHFADLRFFPIAPRCCTLRMYSGAYGTLHSVSPISTVTRPIFSAVSIASALSGLTWLPTAITKLFIVYRTVFGD